VKGWAQCLKDEAVEPARFLVGHNESLGLTRIPKRNVFRTCDLSYSVRGVLLTARRNVSLVWFGMLFLLLLLLISPLDTGATYLRQKTPHLSSVSSLKRASQL